MRPVAVYVHTPFCPSKCGYCDFNSYAMTGPVVERTVAAIVAEIERTPWRGRPAKTVFFGGGTPTYLPLPGLLAILREVLVAHPPIEGCEITSEANPGTVDAEKFSAMREAGFNRLSLGAQSFQESELSRLGRVHGVGEIERAVHAARKAGFDNLNLDLMFALPNQTRRGWESNLERALALRPEHLSLYCLTIEPNTAFFKEHLRGTLPLPSEDEQVAMYERCLDRAAEAGLRQYEISNFAQPGKECGHNLCYWRGEEYLAYGPGAVGSVNCGAGFQPCGAGFQPADDCSAGFQPADDCSAGFQPAIPSNRTRYTNLKHPDRYCAAIEAGQTAAYDLETLDEQTLRTERVMLGLRLNEGVDESFDREALGSLERKGWVEVDRQRVRLTREGRHFCSEVAVELI